MDYLTVAEGRARAGLRLVLTAHVPGPWGQAAKSLFKYRQVPFVAVAQAAMEANEELVAWTGRRNAPLAIYNDEPVCEDWLAILMLAERLGSGPSLLPDRPIDRVLCLGFSAEICGHWGLGWCRRISMWTLGGPPRTPQLGELRRAYGYTDEQARRAPARLREIVAALDGQLAAQNASGRDYLIGDRPSACDFYWAAFSIMFDVPDHLTGRIPEYQQAMYATIEPLVAEVLSPALVAHRDMMFERHIGLPIEF